MIDSDRLTGLTPEEIDDLLSTHGREQESDLDHALSVVEGFETIVRNGLRGGVEGNEAYFIGAMSPYIVIGSEAGFWDNIKESSKVLVDVIKKAIKEITDYYNGDGTRQIDNADQKSNEAIDAISKLNNSIPVPEKSSILNKEKYFKTPSVENLDDEQLTLAKSNIDKINTAVGRLEGVRTVGELAIVLKGIRDASIAAAKAVVDQIKKDASAANSAADALNNPDIPASDAPSEVKDAKKQELQEKTKDAKEKGNGVKKIASLRNKFLAPALVVSNITSQVEKLKENKEFKG